jgi:putative tricarboxylic transport membrane protein
VTVKRENIVIGAVLLAFSIGYGYLITRLPTRNLPNTLGIDFIPWVYAIFLAFLSLLLIAVGVWGSRTAGQEDSGATPLTGSELRGAVILFALLFAYIYLIDAVGFLVVTPFVLFAMMLLEGIRRYGRMVLIAVIVTIVVYGLFRYVFEVNITGFALW